MTTWPADDAPEADRVDVAQQQIPVDADDDIDEVEPIPDIGEADPADVIEQAIAVGGGEEGYDRG